MEASKRGHDSESGTNASPSSRKTISLDNKTASPNATISKTASTATTSSSVVTRTAKTSLNKPKKSTSKRKVVDAKATSIAKSNATQSQTKPINQEQRYQLIATAAYLIAEKRGFMGGDPVEDWLQAESEVDATLG